MLVQINQSDFTVETISLTALVRMPTTLNGEQAPINQKRVDKLIDSLMEEPLREPLSVAELNGRRILVSGRHRVQALSEVYADDLSVFVVCLVYPCANPEEVQDLVLAKNGSRSMNAAEKAELSVAAKFGFDDLDKNGLTTIACDVTRDIRERKECLTLALAMNFTEHEDYPLPKNTALKLAETLLTEVNRWVEGKGKDKTRLLDTWLEDSELTLNLILALTDIPAYYQTMTTVVDRETYRTIIDTVPGVFDTDVKLAGDGYKTCIKYPSNLQRVAAKYVKCLPLRKDVTDYMNDAG